MHRNPVILQVSDLHFGRSVNPLELWKASASEDAKRALRRAVLEIEPRPDFIVVTGDLANGGTRAEMKAARDYLDDLLDTLWREGHAARCIVVPGNHDVWRTTGARLSGYLGRRDRLKEWNETFGGWSFLSAEVPSDAAAHLRPQSLFEYYRGGDASESARAEAQLKAARAASACEYFPEFRLAFLKLDSTVRSNRWKPAHIARGMVGTAQRTQVDQILYDYERASRNEPMKFADARLIALVHHHVTRLPNVTLENWMLMDDAGEVARWLARHGVRFVLHGHYHRADLVGLTYWAADRDNSRLNTIVISAGSATSTDVGDRHNSCYYLHLGEFHTKVFRPLIEAAEYQPLNAAAAFEFVHEPELSIEEARAPLFLDALKVSLATEERYADREHSYTSVESAGYIDDDRSYWATVTLKGVNETIYQTHGVPFVFTAVGAQYFHECQCTATDLATGRPLPPPDLVENRPVNCFPSRVHFLRPLDPQATFGIQITYKLKMVMLDEWDFDMINLLRFPRGVGRLTMRLLASRPMVGPTFLELRGQRLTRSGVVVRSVTAAPANPSGVRPMSGYEVTVEPASALCYLLMYEKLGGTP